MADEAVWIFVGVLIGIPLGAVATWIFTQVLNPQSSTVVLERTERGYIIHEH
jgi:hypothetical protein